ncbi:ABC transporter permease [Pararoseomonas indoligenes]|uniref:ABC transporter permease subunit n=1 Tax=Roseomonas indoligenes TaxID=2820811 RepID=A0A940S5Y1_9PROT|nr:ABC transporter permease subunit [Pararoseomonas indoligenes]MBP0491368.1 ABC transporter permease subunit [Pararoseomonas indoligenes]
MKPDSFRAALLAAPLALLVLLGAVAPLGALLRRGTGETEVAPALPRTLRVLRQWDGNSLPDDMAFEALAADLAALRAAGPAGAEAMARAAERLAADVPALREVLPGTAERAERTRTTRAAAILVADPAWGERESWVALRRAGQAMSGFHLLSAIGLRITAEGGLEDGPRGPHARALLARGLCAAVLAVLGCLVLAWPLARWIAEAPPRRAAILAALTVLPLFSGEAARAVGWAPLLGPGPEAGLVVTTLGLLPLMVLPIALVLHRAGPRLPRAAAALGLSPRKVFWRISLPLARRGIAVGCAVVFAQALGVFIAPGLLDPEAPLAAGALAVAARGGDWGQAGALAVWLLLPVLPAAFLLRRGLRG